MVTTLVRRIGTTPSRFIRPGRRAEAVRGVGTGEQCRTAGLGVRGGDGGQLRLFVCCQGSRVHHHSSGGRLVRKPAAKSIPSAADGGRTSDRRQQRGCTAWLDLDGLFCVGEEGTGSGGVVRVRVSLCLLRRGEGAVCCVCYDDPVQCLHNTKQSMADVG